MMVNSNVPGALPEGRSRPYEVVDVGGSKVGVVGLLTSEDGVFRKNVFRGLEILESLETARAVSRELRDELGCARVVALTRRAGWDTGESLCSSALSRRATVDTLKRGATQV